MRPTKAKRLSPSKPDSLLPIGSEDLSNNNCSCCICSFCLVILYFFCICFVCFVFCSVSFFVCPGTGSWNRCVNDGHLPLFFLLVQFKEGTMTFS